MTTTGFPQRAPVPPAVRRLVAWFFLPAISWVVCAIIALTPAVREWAATPRLWVGVAIPLLLVAPLLVCIVFLWKGQRRIRRAVVAASGRACVNCTGDLRGKGDTGTCPACGQAFDTAADQRSWSRVGMLK
ncbi:MAG: hypothetical protein IBJ11_10735 [Phycisphaerales bacterium]|nr:hypothetical protein [Phycisphaerales bacterium]